MISYAITESTEEEDGFRVLKVSEDGVKTAFLAEAFGEDSNPLKNMTALLAETQADGEMTIIGFLDVDKVAAVGEKRLFSLKENGEVSSYIWLKNNEEIHFNGDTNYLVKYNELKAKCDELQNFINTELPKIQAGISGAGGAYTPGTLNFDISNSQAEKLKCG